MAKKKKAGKKRGGKGKVDTNAIIDGVLAGVAPGLVQKFAGNILGGFTTAASLGAVGYFRKNQTLMTLAGFEAAKAFTGGAAGSILGGGNGQNGFFEG